jgi:molybdopterin-guanine dinucleotide biosynthesis protein A
MINDCTAIILAGGDSRRMGRDKATLPFGGKTLLQAVIATMQQLFPATLVSVRQIRPEISLPQVCDTQSDGGPLTGLVTALSTIHTSWAFVVGCDMPFVSPALVEQLAAHRARQQAVVPVVHGQLQPLAAFYSTGCIPVMRASLALGDKSLLSAIKNLNVCYMDEMQMRRADPQLRSFFDLDTPQDLITAQGDLTIAQGMVMRLE